MKAAEVDEAIGAQEEVGDEGSDGVQFSCNDIEDRNQNTPLIHILQNHVNCFKNNEKHSTVETLSYKNTCASIL